MEQEALGTKKKFWYRKNRSLSSWLFKYPQVGVGQHWSEKIAAELASEVKIFRAKVKLAVFDGHKGSATENFSEGADLYHGNQILAGYVLGYDREKKRRQSDHTLVNIFSALDKTFNEVALKYKRVMADYLVLDALIGNTDRHHENWGVVRKHKDGKWSGYLAPSFDHASSLGRELVDEGRAKSRLAIMRSSGGMRAYSERAEGAIFWEKTDNCGFNPIELVRRANDAYPSIIGPALKKLDLLNKRAVARIVERVPRDWMSDIAKSFTVDLVWYNLGVLKEI